MAMRPCVDGALPANRSFNRRAGAPMTDEKNRRQSTLYRYSFGTAEFDEAAFTLRVEGEPIEVQRNPLEILTLRLHHSQAAQVWTGLLPSIA
jgi:eukaryotic-like serine/threonine-protein kinase